MAWIVAIALAPVAIGHLLAAVYLRRGWVQMLVLGSAVAANVSVLMAGAAMSQGLRIALIALAAALLVVFPKIERKFPWALRNTRTPN